MQHNPPFAVLDVDLPSGRSRSTLFSGSGACLGGSGLAEALHERPAPPGTRDPPVVFAIGPLTGYFPSMSKTVCAFVSPHTGQYAESHAGGRLALALRRAGYDALVLWGRATAPSVLHAGRGGARLSRAEHLAGLDCGAVHDAVARSLPAGAGRASITVTGPAARAGCTFACATVDRHRHFGRLGLGAALAARNITALAILGDGVLDLPDSDAYAALRRTLMQQAARSPALEKYRGPGTAQIVNQLNALSALPWRNLSRSTDPRAKALAGEHIPYALPVRKAACEGCPIGCIHLGALEDGHGPARMVGYDFEHMVACGAMLGLADPRQVLELVAEVEAQGLDVISTGVCLAWATEATGRALVDETLTGVRLRFGDGPGYARAVRLLGGGQGEFWQALGRGAAHAASIYGGADFACVLGQEMAGYACGPVFFAAQALNFRHSHLDNACYALDMEHPGAAPEELAALLLRDETLRVGINCMVACLFARHIYPPEVLAECLAAVGHTAAARDLGPLAEAVRRRRWQRKFASGFDPDAVTIPRRFTEVTTASGPVTPEALEAMRRAYAAAIRSLLD